MTCTHNGNDVKVGTIDKLLSFLPGGMFGGMGAMGKPKEAMQANLDRYRVIMTR